MLCLILHSYVYNKGYTHLLPSNIARNGTMIRKYFLLVRNQKLRPEWKQQLLYLLMYKRSKYGKLPAMVYICIHIID